MSQAISKTVPTPIELLRGIRDEIERGNVAVIVRGSRISVINEEATKYMSAEILAAIQAAEGRI